MFDWRFVPLNGKYPRQLTPADARITSKFKKTWDRVLKDLERETDMLEAREGSVVIATFHEPYMVRNDGKLRSDAGAPKYPGVVVRFDVRSEDLTKWIPMSFECDQFTNWKANVQAVAEALEALRKVDRYGVSSRGKERAHYEGYKALPSAEGKRTSREDAAAFLAQHSGVAMQEILVSETARAAAYRKAAQKLHPDKTNNTEEFMKLTEANRVLSSITDHAAAGGK